MYMCVAIWRYTNRNFRAGVRMQRAVRYHTSPVSLFSISLVCLLLFSPPPPHPLIRIRRYVFTACPFSQREFFPSAPGTRAPTQQRGYLGSATISRRGCRATLRTRRSYTNAGENLHVPADSQPRSRATSLQNLQLEFIITYAHSARRFDCH